MANENNNKLIINGEALSRVDDLLAGLKEDAQKAHAENDAFMSSVYLEILATVSKIAIKAHARVERENLASLRANNKALRKATKNTTEATETQG